MPKFASTLPDMSGVMRDSPHKPILEDMLTRLRLRATTLIRETMPHKIERLQQLLDSQNDPNSLMWTGHMSQGDYIHPRVLHPGQTAATDGPLPNDQITGGVDGLSISNGRHRNMEDELMMIDGRQVVLPEDITVGALGKGQINDDESDCPKKGGAAGARVGQHWFEVVPRNTVHNQLMDLALAELEELQDICMTLKTWLELEIPVIEDGNSFGADVQEHLIRHIDSVWKRCAACQNGTRQHHLDRIKLVTDWVKYPNVMDFPAAIAKSDQSDHHFVRSYLKHALVGYGGILTRLERNWPKVINPKGNSSSGEAMY